MRRWVALRAVAMFAVEMALALALVVLTEDSRLAQGVVAAVMLLISLCLLWASRVVSRRS